MALFAFKKKAEERAFFPETAPAYSSGMFQIETNPTASACINKIANTLSILPMQLYAHTKTGKKLAISNPLFRILEKPAYEETPNLFYGNLVRQLLGTGNAFVYISRNSNGVIINLSLCDSRLVTVERDQNYKKVFVISGKRYTERDILHIPYIGAGYNGTVGMSPMKAYHELIELDNEMLRYVDNYFHNSVGKRMAMELGSSYGTNMQNMSKLYGGIMPIFNKFVTGAQNAGKPMIMPPDTKLTTIDQGNNAEAELSSLLEWCEQAISTTLFNCPYEIINSKAQKYASLEMQQNLFLSNCIQPLGDHICKSFEKLLDPSDRLLYIQYEYKNLLSTNTGDTINFLAKELQSGMLSLNEARKKLGMEDIGSAGDYYWMPANLIPVTEENVKAIMAKQKIAMEEDHNPAGDDK